MTGIHYDLPGALDRLNAVFPGFDQTLTGKRIIDFGCGGGYQAVALALAGADGVVGVEQEDSLVAQANDRARKHGVADKVRIDRSIPAGLKAHIIVSQNSFEHFLEAGHILEEMHSALLPEGKIYITFAPPWYAPWGAHMAFFCRLPWVQLLFSERTVLDVRGLYRPDGARTYYEAGLAKMSIRHFERIIRRSGLQMIYRRYDCVRGFTLLSYIPLIRELAINRVSCILCSSL